MSHDPLWVPPGHFYSPIPSIAEILSREQEIFGAPIDAIAGIDLREEAQCTLLKELQSYYAELPFQDKQAPALRYYYDNPMYSYGDAICLYGMLRRSHPRRIIEVGSGFSSAAILDTAERFLEEIPACTFIDPYPERLLSLLRPGDTERIVLYQQSVQDIPPSVFASLEAGDVLFIDSTHIAKTGSDVLYLFFHILPILRNGVLIHIHDIFAGFEYPQTWVEEGRSWNEAYMLRAFLQYNEHFRILLWNNFLYRKYRDLCLACMPLCAKNPGGSIWLEKC